VGVGASGSGHLRERRKGKKGEVRTTGSTKKRCKASILVGQNLTLFSQSKGAFTTKKGKNGKKGGLVSVQFLTRGGNITILQMGSIMDSLLTGRGGLAF